jgi:hypothetical protein
MGPAIIFDKSAFQGLDAQEHNMGHFMFYENVTPILLREIAGDLAKPDGRRSAESLVQELARKFSGSGGCVNEDWKDLCAGSLAGQPVPMTGQIIPGPDAIHATSAADGGAVLLGPARGNRAILRWAEAHFVEGEQRAAERFRGGAQSFDTSAFGKRLEDLPVPTARDIASIPLVVDELLARDAPASGRIVDWLVDELRPLGRRGWRVPQLRQVARHRFQTLGSSAWLSSPYARHCVRTLLMLLVGRGVLSARPTNRLDIEYLIYLPFCHVFVSDDKLHRQLAPFLVRADQTFVPIDVLKADLKRCWFERSTATSDVRARRDRCFGTRPWPAPDSILWTLCEKLDPWQPSCGNAAIRLTPHQLTLAETEARELVAVANASPSPLVVGSAPNSSSA